MTLPFATVLILLVSVLLRAVGASLTGLTVIFNEPSTIEVPSETLYPIAGTAPL